MDKSPDSKKGVTVEQINGKRKTSGAIIFGLTAPALIFLSIVHSMYYSDVASLLAPACAGQFMFSLLCGLRSRYRALTPIDKFFLYAGFLIWLIISYIAFIVLDLAGVNPWIFDAF